MMQISPTDVELMVEAKVPPADIGLLRTGRPVSIKLDPFDYSIYGSLQGELSYISADTLTEQAPNGQVQTFYRVQIKFNTEQDNRKLQLNDLKPGMTANVDVLTGSRSVLTYLTKPITKAFQGAASQR
ncbi:MAG: HlyD family efflux transporter periplasmic adaptor subunit [Betaproteobacteria bacterium]|nr:HlyD family efflux transporter periplasmic adaptor subunit [Betaproteobacteria bacterium]